MEWRIATWADVESVLDRLAEQNRAEYKALGFPGHAFNLRLLHFMMGGDTQVLWFDGKPQAFVAIAPTPGFGGATTWFGATTEAFERGAGPIKMGRQLLRDALAKHGELTSVITSKHPKVGQWLKLFGYKLARTSGDIKVFTFT